MCARSWVWMDALNVLHQQNTCVYAWDAWESHYWKFHLIARVYLSIDVWCPQPLSKVQRPTSSSPQENTQAHTKHTDFAMRRAVPFVFTEKQSNNRWTFVGPLYGRTLLVLPYRWQSWRSRCKVQERWTVTLLKIVCEVRLHKLTEKHNYCQTRAEHTLHLHLQCTFLFLQVANTSNNGRVCARSE